MSGAAAASPRGMERSGSRTSSAMNGSDSAPVNANAITDKKISSFKSKVGRRVVGVSVVAKPNFSHAATPRASKITMIDVRQIAATFTSSLPVSKPKMLSAVPIARPPSENAMKNAGDPALAGDLPIRYSALPAVKYNSAGKYATVLNQDVHAAFARIFRGQKNDHDAERREHRCAADHPCEQRRRARRRGSCDPLKVRARDQKVQRDIDEPHTATEPRFHEGAAFSQPSGPASSGARRRRPGRRPFRAPSS